MNDPVKARGLWLKQGGDAPVLAETFEMLVAEIREGVRQLKGEAAARKLRSEGLEALHTVIDSTEIGALRDFVLDRNRPRLLALAVAVGRNVLHWADEFYVDDYLILRINFPYDVARKADPSAENPGIGRISPHVRELAKSRRVIDPVYDPKGYHRGHPPAAWAHGPHQDSWAGHSKDGLNIWWAMCDVPREASMVLYPELAGLDLPPDPRTLYLAQDFNLPRPTFLPLKAGEMLIFDPEILHGTHLNVTPQTRVAVSLRLNSRKPTFDPGCFYAREFWRKASDIESGAWNTVLHLKREDNLSKSEPLSRAPRPAMPVAVPGNYLDGPDSDMSVALTNRIAEGERVVVALPDKRVLLHRTDGQLRAIDAACPHYGVDLSYGGYDDRQLYCPACGVGYDLKRGASHSEHLTLAFYEVAEDGLQILIRNAG